MNRGLYVNRPFMIVSRMWMNRVVSVAGGWNLVIQTRKDNEKRQQWIFDMTSKTIKSMHARDRSMDFRGGNVYAYATDSRWYQLMKYDNGWFVNEKGQVLAVQSKLDHENRQVVRENRNTEIHQQWDVLYLDAAKPVPTKGFSKVWGMYINRPFHIVTQMTSGRYMDYVSNRLVIKTPNERATQEFYFDYVTRTIRCKGYNDYALDIRNTAAYGYGVNSYWY